MDCQEIQEGIEKKCTTGKGKGREAKHALEKLWETWEGARYKVRK